MRSATLRPSLRPPRTSPQQHATVYWSDTSDTVLAQLDPCHSISSQLLAGGAFSRSIVPNWQDASTSAQCDAFRRCAFEQMRHLFGSTEYSPQAGDEALTRLTGSAAHTRFSGEQIMKFREQEPEKWSRTQRIGLVSSALSTLLTQTHQGIDESDACGMNLWQLSCPVPNTSTGEALESEAEQRRDWNEGLLQQVAGSPQETGRLRQMLGEVERDTGRVIGRIGQWFVQRYGFDEQCIVCPGTGDNPATFLSFARELGFNSHVAAC